MAIDSLTTLRVAGGQYLQSPGFEKLLDPDNLFNLARYSQLDSLETEQAVHLGASLSRRWRDRWRVQVEVYSKWLSRLITQTEQATLQPTALYRPTGGEERQLGLLDAESYLVRERDVFVLTPDPVNAGSGRAYGLEVFIERRSGGPGDPWSGWLSYALARANREQVVGGERIRFPFTYDRRHTLNLMIQRRLGEAFQAGLTWRFGSGFPYTPARGLRPLVAEVIDPDTGSLRGVVLTDPVTGFVRLVPDFAGVTNLNSARLPAYHRLDLRVGYTTLWQGQPVEVYLDLINVYNRKNVVSYKYVIDVFEPSGEGLPISLRPPAEPILYLEPVYMLPFIPSLGFNFTF